MENKVGGAGAGARSKNRADNPEIMKTEGQTPQTQVSQEREDELKAHEEDLAPRPKRAERKQRGENAIASHEARLETHTTTSGETTIDDAPVLNEGLMSESEKPKAPPSWTSWISPDQCVK